MIKCLAAVSLQGKKKKEKKENFIFGGAKNMQQSRGQHIYMCFSQLRQNKHLQNILLENSEQKKRGLVAVVEEIKDHLSFQCRLIFTEMFLFK